MFFKRGTTCSITITGNFGKVQVVGELLYDYAPATEADYVILQDNRGYTDKIATKYIDNIKEVVD